MVKKKQNINIDILPPLAKKQFKALVVELETLEKQGATDSMSLTYLDTLKAKIRQALKVIFGSIYKSQAQLYNKELRNSYFSILKELPNKNQGLSKYALNELKPEFLKAYKIASANSLDLIRTQNNENLLKLQNRFYDWITLKSVNDNKAKLQDLVELPRTKRINFILKDQTHKLNASIDLAIASKYNAICFQWKTVLDKRVVGKPGGLYPKASNPAMHGNHYARHNQFYYYRKNLTQQDRRKLKMSAFAGCAEDIPDGLPGLPIGCRCYAKNFYDIEDLPKELLK